MARYNSRYGTTAECIAFQEGTDPELEGFWYHATNQRNAMGFSCGTKRFESRGSKLPKKISFTRDPRGAARNLANWEKDRWVIRATIQAPRTEVSMQDNGITGGFLWLHVSDVRQIMVEAGSFRERDAADIAT